MTFKPGTPVQLKPNCHLSDSGSDYHLEPNKVYYVQRCENEHLIWPTVFLYGSKLGYDLNRFEIAHDLTELEKAIYVE